jgi:lipopolysaccharide biosynthesis protein
MLNKKIRAIAIYLPQFHSIPENDAWWGKDFTEWTNVRKARPLYKGHYQPHVPSDLGYYDLRSPDILKKQYALAKRYGIHGFMFYHYWFNGKLLLDSPVDALFADKDFNLPFCFCWANENWTRRWDGKDRDILMEQKYSRDDDLHHIQYLIKYFKDDRYMKVDEKPVLAVYRTNLLPDAKSTADLWRSEAKKAGFADIYLINVEAMEWDKDPALIGFDAGMEFQPQWEDAARLRRMPRFDERVRNKMSRWGILKRRPFIYGNMNVDYPSYIRDQLKNAIYDVYKKYPCVMPSWDNSARRTNGKALIFSDSSPVEFAFWLRGVLGKFEPFSIDENFLFINAWNEWAEGNHVEPCERWGYGNLEAIKESLDNRNDN